MVIADLFYTINFVANDYICSTHCTTKRRLLSKATIACLRKQPLIYYALFTKGKQQCNITPLVEFNTIIWSDVI